jgi:hypothetical protein
MTRLPARELVLLSSVEDDALGEELQVIWEIEPGARIIEETHLPQPVFPRKFDLLILDEAHNVAPSGRGKYATDSLRTQALRHLAPHFEYKLFLSATPHNGYPESFAALLELLGSLSRAGD